MVNEIVWIIVVVVFIIIEASTAAVVSVWFAGGGLVALVATAFGADVKLQIFLFMISSLLFIILLRKIAFKTIKEKTTHTNLDRIIGSDVLIEEEVNNKLHTGNARIGDVLWKVKSENGEVIPKDETAKVIAIEGVRLIVKK